MAKKRSSKDKDTESALGCGCLFLIAVVATFVNYAQQNPIPAVVILSVIIFVFIIIVQSLTSHSFEGLSNVSANNYQNLPKLNAPAGYVYVIKDLKYQKYKIGRTVNPRSRIRDIQRNEVGELKYIHLIRTQDAAATEKNLHERYAKFRIRKDREWFELGETQLQDIRNLVSPKQNKRDYSSIWVGASASLLLSLFIFIGITSFFPTSPSAQQANQAPLPRNTNTPSYRTKRPTVTRSATTAASNTSILTRQPTATKTSHATPTPNLLYVRHFRDGSSARIRACAGTETCAIIGGLRSGDIIHSPEYIIGEAVNGNKQWIRFRFNDDHGYIHSSLVTDNFSRGLTPPP